MTSVSSYMEKIPKKAQLALAGFYLTYRMVEALVNQWLENRRSRDPRDRYAKTELVYARNLAIWEKTLGVEHPHVALGLNNMAEAYRAQGKFAEAEPLYQRALEIYKKKLGPEDPKLAMVLWNHAYLLWETKSYVEAAKIGVRAMEVKAKQAQ